MGKPSRTAHAVRDAQQLSRQVKDDGLALGFDAVGITTPDAIGEAGARLAAFLEDGAHGDMAWMAETAHRRADPRVLWPAARAAVMAGQSYAPACDPLRQLDDASRGAISVYAQGKDYHDVMKGRLKQLAGKLAAATGAEVKVFVDTAPLMEKPLAAAAGLGWQGKHTNLVSGEHGSWLFLGAILTTAELEADTQHSDQCGSCRRCLDICPTGAFPAPYRLDARRCIAYLTIEHKGHIGEEFRAAIGNRIFGCDDCLAVCPWNKFAEVSREARYHARAGLETPPLGELLRLDWEAFRIRFAGTPVRRTGRDRFVRNVLIAAGNARDASLLPEVERLLADTSPLVRAMAIWALARLASRPRYAELAARHLPAETDADVAAEWTRGAST